MNMAAIIVQSSHHCRNGWGAKCIPLQHCILFCKFWKLAMWPRPSLNPWMTWSSTPHLVVISVTRILIDVIGLISQKHAAAYCHGLWSVVGRQRSKYASEETQNTDSLFTHLLKVSSSGSPAFSSKSGSTVKSVKMTTACAANTKISNRDWDSLAVHWIYQPNSWEKETAFNCAQQTVCSLYTNKHCQTWRIRQCHATL